MPTGIGHTTSCFLQVEGAVENDAYLMTEDSEERKSVQTLGQLGNALCSEKLAPNSKVRIVWPKDRCKMLEEEVVLIDSPGIDVESDLDEWIDKFCLDSDVFVLVANAESTIMLTEKVRIWKQFVSLFLFLFVIIVKLGSSNIVNNFKQFLLLRYESIFEMQFSRFLSKIFTLVTKGIF